MRVLWLVGNQSFFSNEKKGYNGGGWIGSLESALVECNDVSLGVAFFSDSKAFKVEIKKTIYYPIRLYSSFYNKLRRQINYGWADSIEISYIKKVVYDFNPDIIHIWGTEFSFGLIKEVTNVPVIIHLQGILSAVYNSFFTPGMSRNTYINQSGFNIFTRIQKTRNLWYLRYRVNREMRILKICNNFMGRTSWDKQLINLYAPNSSYYHCDEMLRPAFYNGPLWNIKDREIRIIVTTLSDATYKGLDNILKCASILKEHCELSYVWQVYGVNNPRAFECFTKIDSQKVNVIFNGIVKGDYLRDMLVEADLYVNTSYIENSPNSVCEAQILGLPIISTNVGGTSSIVKHEISGVLVPSNDPFILASEIIKLISSPDRALYYSINGQKEASIRHDPKRIVPALKSIYEKIIV